MKVVLDTNVIVSALMKPDSKPHSLVEAWHKGAFELITSAALIAELEEVIARPAVSRFTRLSPPEQAEFLAGLAGGATVTQPNESLAVSAADPADDRVLEAAVAGDADYICSGDADLLALGEFRGIRIITPAYLLAVLAEQRAE